jgi:hypothetical protein
MKKIKIGSCVYQIQYSQEVAAIKYCINTFCMPHNVDKVDCIIPTANGYHLITDRFDVMEFQKHFPNVDIQKKNPTLLYLPDILHSEKNS